MKVATNTIYNQIRERINWANEELNKAIDAVTNGQKINKLSDDPFRLAQILESKVELSDMRQFKKNIEMGEVWLYASESSISGVQDRIVEARTTALEMVNDNKNAGDREIGAMKIAELMQDLVEVANTDVNGRYIFAGTKTDQPPFRMINNQGGESNGTVSTRVEYLGDSKPFEIKTDKNLTVEVGNDGAVMFNSMFDTFIRLRDALKNNDLDGIQEEITTLNDHYEDMASFGASVGFKLNRLEFRTNVIEEFDLTTQKQLSDLSEIDLAEAITNMQTKQLAYQASLTASTKVLSSKSLMDYL